MRIFLDFKKVSCFDQYNNPLFAKVFAKYVLKPDPDSPNEADS